MTVTLFLQPITKDMFDDALRELQDEDFLIVTNKVIRLIETFAK